MDEKRLKTLFYPSPGRLRRSITFLQVETKKSLAGHFRPCKDEENKKYKKSNKIGAKMKTLAIPCWPDRPVRPSMQLLDAKAFSARFVRPMPDWRWRTAMVKIRSDQAPDCRRKVSWFPAVRRPQLATKEFRPVPPFIPKHQARRHCDGIRPFQVCPSAQHHELSTVLVRAEGCLHQVLLVRHGQHSARPDWAHHVQKKNRWFEGLAAKPKPRNSTKRRTTRFAHPDYREWSETTCTLAYIRRHVSSAWQPVS